MKRSIKTSLIVIAVALLACIFWLVWLGSRPEEMNEPVAPSVADASQGPSFEVRVVVPRLARPLAGILPDWVVAKFGGTPSELRFNNASRGAKIGSVGSDRLELSSDDWNLSMEADGAGRITPGTRLVFPLALGGRHLKLRCRPASQPSGAFQTTKRAGSDELDGRFLVELATCENAESGKTTNWPPSPLTVRGSFARLPQRHR